MLTMCSNFVTACRKEYSPRLKCGGQPFQSCPPFIGLLHQLCVLDNNYQSRRLLPFGGLEIPTVAAGRLEEPAMVRSGAVNPGLDGRGQTGRRGAQGLCRRLRDGEAGSGSARMYNKLLLPSSHTYKTHQARAEQPCGGRNRGGGNSRLRCQSLKSRGSVIMQVNS
jgi:hypothetical protein